MTAPPRPTVAATAALLQLADGRFPTGAHAHSAGMEEAVADGRVADLDDLDRFLVGRLWTVGLVEAAVAAAACLEARRPSPGWAGLDAEAAARCPSEVLRRVGRTLGRGLLRTAALAWPGPWVDHLRHAVPTGALAPVVLGAAARAAGLDPPAAALLGAHGSVGAPAGAAVRLLGLDPFAVAALLAGLAPPIDDVAARAAARASDLDPDWSGLPAPSALLCDVGAQRHAAWEVRLFAS